MSSAEADLVACVKMCTEVLGLVQLMADWGCDRAAKVYLDSSAAIGVAQRRGNGKLRHVKVGTLWIQESVEAAELEIKKVAGALNPADAMTKYLTGPKIIDLMRRMSQEFRDCFSLFQRIK